MQRCDPIYATWIFFKLYHRHYPVYLGTSNVNHCGEIFSCSGMSRWFVRGYVSPAVWYVIHDRIYATWNFFKLYHRHCPVYFGGSNVNHCGRNDTVMRDHVYLCRWQLRELGLVGYDDCLTRNRSRVRFSELVLKIFYFVAAAAVYVSNISGPMV